MEYTTVVNWCLLCVFTFCGVSCAEYCPSDDGTNIDYCDHGCCGDDYRDQHCCLPTTWIIVGCILGALIIGAIIFVIVCIFYKSKGNSGRVVVPQGGVSTVTYTTHLNQGYYAQPSAPPYQVNYHNQYGQQPNPQYEQQQQQPPPPFNGNYTDPAFPPPATYNSHS